MDVCDSFGGTRAGVGVPSVPCRGCEIFGGGELTLWPSVFLRRSIHTHTHTQLGVVIIICCYSYVHCTVTTSNAHELCELG